MEEAYQQIGQIIYYNKQSNYNPIITIINSLILYITNNNLLINDKNTLIDDINTYSGIGQKIMQFELTHTHQNNPIYHTCIELYNTLQRLKN